MKTLLNILRHDAIFKDVYREVGLLEVMVTCLHRYAGLLKETHEIKDEGPTGLSDLFKESVGDWLLFRIKLFRIRN